MKRRRILSGSVGVGIRIYDTLSATSYINITSFTYNAMKQISQAIGFQIVPSVSLLPSVYHKMAPTSFCNECYLLGTSHVFPVSIERYLQ